MKVVIIGGGIAGLTLGALLHRKNIDFIVNERAIGNPSHGHAFLMHTDGLAILDELSTEYQAELPGNFLDTFSLCRPDGQEIRRTPLFSWKCIKRSDMIHFLSSLLPAVQVKRGRQFSHFIYEEDKVVAAAFFNGDIEYGDLFVGADGSNSKIRQYLFGSTAFTPKVVKEVVGVANYPEFARDNASIFTKYQHSDKGLSFGAIPVSAEQVVWFMQYDASARDIMQNSPDDIESFCHKQLEEFPEVVKQILNANDFTSTYIWNTTDFDLLPAFHKGNVVLIGDAAHLALPFTSSGTTNAVIDAKVLLECMEYTGSYEKAFSKFYQLRAEEVAKHTALGRQLKQLFLYPQTQQEEGMPLPLISRRRSLGRKKEEKHQPIKVIYFTDPICSTCWIIQPQLRKLKLEYGRYLDIKYHMGGLLSCWEDGNTGSIKSPDDAARHWNEACRIYEMPMDGDVWIEDPLNSSYPPSIAFKAAQIQDENKAVLFLRRIQEMVFLEKKNIIKWQYIENAAFDAGLDCTKLLADFKKRAPEAFKSDLALAKEYKVTGFPTLFFSDGSGKQFMLRGNQPYEQFENLVTALLPSAQKEEIDYSPEELFELFPTLTDKEFAVLSNISKEEAAGILNSLLDSGQVEKQVSKSGVIWKSKVAVS